MNITIDNKEVKSDPAATILDVAAENNIYIPSLCAHPELTPYGGCRLCVVEVEGRKGYPTACNTFVEEGMVVRTDTKTLQEMRSDLIQLILSEHPAACLICEDVEGCTGYQETIRKVGITTGCRWCPKDQDCDFQRIVEHLDITDLTLPGLYRDLPLEKYDPFYDRDYNLCIYCGRCVRICDEVRRSSVLSLKQRGKQTTIGPAFESTHIDADCEFCGACVSVCPTGAMSEKSRKWWGVPDEYHTSICPLCSLNCEIQSLTLKNRLVGTIPPGNPHDSGGDLCVKGRFCLSEIVNRTKRILEPEYRYPEGYGIVSWNQAFEKAEEILQKVKPDRSAVLLSPGLSLEEIQGASQFASKVLSTKLVSSSCIEEVMLHYIDLARQSVTIDELKKADAMVSLFLDGNYKYAPLTIAIKELAEMGVPYVKMGWIRDTTSRFADQQLIPIPGQETACFDQFKDLLKKNKKSVIIVGPEILSLTNRISLLTEIKKLVQTTHSKVFMPNPFGNLEGMLRMTDFYRFDEIVKQIDKGKIDLLYLIGDTPFEKRPDVKTIIYQNAYPPVPELNPDLVLPATLWSESSGSYLDMFGKIKKAQRVTEPHGYALSHLEIFKKIARKMNKESLKVAGAFIRNKIKENKKLKLKPVSNSSVPNLSVNGLPFVLVQESPQHVYHYLNLSVGVEGFGELVKTDQVIMHPIDAQKMGIRKGETVTVISKKRKHKYPVNVRKTVHPGHLVLTSSGYQNEFESNPCSVKIKLENV